MLVQGQVGAPQQGMSTGTTPPVRQGALGDMIVSELHGRYFEQAYRRNMYSGAIASATGVTATALGIVTATAYTGVVLYNPPNSQIVCALQRVGWALPIAPAAATVVSLGQFYSPGIPYTTTAITTRNNYINGPAPTAQLFSVATFGIATTAPITTIPTHTLGWVGTVAASSTSNIINNTDFEGSVIIPPGGGVCIYLSTVAQTNGFFGSMSWEEVPIVY